jgi:hypothetical protein
MPKQILFTVIVFNSLVVLLPIMMFVLYKRPGWWQYMFALFLGIVTGWIDVASTEVQLPAILLIVFGFFLGFARTRDAWQWGLILGIWVPLLQSASVIAGIEPYRPGQTISSLLSLGFAFAGAYLGVLLSRFSSHIEGPANSQQTIPSSAPASGLSSAPH